MSTFLQMTGRVMDYTHRPKINDDTEVRALVNDAYVYAVSQLRCYQKPATALALTANVGDYSITTDLGLSDFSTLRVVQYTASSGSTTLNTLAPTTPDEIMAQRQLNPSATSPAVAYALAGWDTIMFQPVAAAGDTVSFIYGATPALMILDGDTPLRLPQEWHHLIVERAAATAFEVVDDGRALLHQNAFDAELKKARLWFAERVGSRGFAPLADNTARIWPSQYFSTLG